MNANAKLFLESEELYINTSKQYYDCPCFVAAECILYYLSDSETPREKTSMLIRRKEAGLPLEICKAEQLIERGSR